MRPAPIGRGRGSVWWGVRPRAGWTRPRPRTPRTRPGACASAWRLSCLGRCSSTSTAWSPLRGSSRRCTRCLRPASPSPRRATICCARWLRRSSCAAPSSVACRSSSSSANGPCCCTASWARSNSPSASGSPTGASSMRSAGTRRATRATRTGRGRCSSPTRWNRRRPAPGHRFRDVEMIARRPRPGALREAAAAYLRLSLARQRERGEPAHPLAEETLSSLEGASGSGPADAPGG